MSRDVSSAPAATSGMAQSSHMNSEPSGQIAGRGFRGLVIAIANLLAPGDHRLAAGVVSGHAIPSSFDRLEPVAVQLDLRHGKCNSHIDGRSWTDHALLLNPDLDFSQASRDNRVERLRRHDSLDDSVSIGGYPDR